MSLGNANSRCGAVAAGLIASALGFSAAAAQSYPIRQPPKYPSVAAFWGIEALCLIEFDLTDSGQPEHVCATCATMTGASADLFVRAAEDAVEQWIYAPLGHSESPAMRYDLQTQLVFEMAKGHAAATDVALRDLALPSSGCDAIS